MSFCSHRWSPDHDQCRLSDNHSDGNSRSKREGRVKEDDGPDGREDDVAQDFRTSPKRGSRVSPLFGNKTA